MSHKPLVCLFSILGLAACSSNEPGAGSFGVGGATAASSNGGASTAAGGSVGNGGAVGPGGTATSSGGSNATATTGGNSGVGGNNSTGGNNSVGGNNSTGGNISIGGNSTAGGNTSAGGKATTGGTSPAGGKATTGGSATAGGSSPTGGSKATGGSSVGGSNLGGASVGGAGTGGAAQTGGAVSAVDCTKVAKAPASFEALTGFTSSEDFAFDLQGNYVGVDDSGNLVRVSSDKKKTLWVPSVGTIAGMVVLSDGSVVMCNTDKGALQRVQSNGSVTTVLGGLLYPNGLELGPDGFLYVAENAAGRVRRVNPANGEFTVVAMGLQGPNGVAFSADPTLFYVGSFEGSGVYKVKMSTAGQLGQASVFARPNGSQLKEPALSCPANKEGETCDVPGQFTGGTCKRIGNVIDCIKEGLIVGSGDATPPGSGGGIDGLGVDACGNVYATEFTYGNVWRISPSGTIEKLATLPSTWIPNVKWGRGLGGFATNIMYVADREGSRLFAVSVGVPGASSLFGAK